ncbi:MAG: DinB family protein [Acidobacteriota bacterium]
MSEEAWLRGPIEGIAPVLQPAAHALLQANEDVQALAPTLTADVLWQQAGTATAGFHLIHLAGALDRLFTYARGEMLNDAQKAAARAEAVPHQELSGETLAAVVSAAVDRAMAQLRATPAERVFDPRGIGRAQLPSTVLGCLFHGAEHATRHAGQFITTVKLTLGR